MAYFRKLKSGWQYRISYKDHQGKYREKSKSGFRTKKEAELEADALERQLDDNTDILTYKNMTFLEYFQLWYETYKKGRFSSTYHNDYLQAERNVREFFGQTLLVDITKLKYQKFINYLAKGHAIGTVKKRHGFTRACLDEAFHEGIISKNPTRKITIHGELKSKSNDLKYLDFEDSKKLIHEIIKDINPRWKSRYMILVALATGLRFSEVLGIKWDNIDFQNNTIAITEGYDYTVANDFKELKTESSTRTVTFDNNTAKYLKEYHIANRLAHPEYVFVDKFNTHVSNAATNKTLRKACKRAGIKEITFHGLRHTYCSLLIYKGINIQYISQRLGHSSTAITYDVYSHIIKEFEQQEISKEHELFKDLYQSPGQ